MAGQVWLWIAFWGMTAGAVAIAALSRTGTGKPMPAGVIHTFVPFVAAVFYLLMAFGEGAVVVENGTRASFFARYIDWSVTTPLLLLGLAFAALGTLNGAAALVAALLGADILMIVTGLFADLSPHGSIAKWGWYILSCGFFGAVYYVLWGPLLRMAKARSVEAGRVYQRNAAILSVLWLAYPLVFLVGSEGFSTVTLTVEIAAFAILDLLAKVAYGILASVEHKTARV